MQDEILRLKREKDICILAHSYQAHEILEVADFVGDSFQLSVQAAKAQAGTMLMCGVRFMAETVKILSPEKRVLLSVEDAGSLRFSAGSIYVLLACVCWGFENNCTRRLSDRSPLDVVIVKGLFSGAGALGIAFFAGERLPGAMDALAAMLLGFVAFGMSIFFYIRAQRDLGAARTSAYYALAPFIGAGLSLAIFRDMPGATFFLALAIMIAGAYLASSDGKPA